MPIKNFLTELQKTNLQKALKESEDRNFRQRILMLLIMNDGKSYAEISKLLECEYNNVAYWCYYGNPDNLESLKDKKQKENKIETTKASLQYIDLLIETIDEKSGEYKYEFRRWTTGKLAQVLAEETETELTKEQVTEILKKIQE